MVVKLYILYTWVIQKVFGFLKIFYISDSQFILKFWLPPLSTMMISILKVGTVPRKFKKYLSTTNRLSHFNNSKKFDFILRSCSTNKQLLKNCYARKFLKGFA